MGLAFETEIYLNNDRLAYLLTLLVNNGIIIVNQNKYQAESFEYEFKEFIGELSEFYVQTHHSSKKGKIAKIIDETIDEDIPEEFFNWYSIKYSEDDRELEIILKKNGEQLKKALKRYIRQYWKNRTKSWDAKNHISGENDCEAFYNKIKSLNIRDLHITEIEHIHAILKGYLNGDIKINKIECEIDLSPFSSPMLFCLPYPTDLVTKFYCHMDAKKFCLNFIKGQYKSDYNDTTDKKEEKLEQQQWLLLKGIANYYNKEQKLYIPYNALGIDCFSEKGTFNARKVAITRFNNRFGRLIDNQKIIDEIIEDKKVISIEISALVALKEYLKNNFIVYKKQINKYL